MSKGLRSAYWISPASRVSAVNGLRRTRNPWGQSASPHQPMGRRSWVPEAFGGWCPAQVLAWWIEVGSEPITESSLVSRTLPNGPARAPEPELRNSEGHSSDSINLLGSDYSSPGTLLASKGFIPSLVMRLGVSVQSQTPVASQSWPRQGDSAPLTLLPSRGSNICDQGFLCSRLRSSVPYKFMYTSARDSFRPYTHTRCISRSSPIHPNAVAMSVTLLHLPTALPVAMASHLPSLPVIICSQHKSQRDLFKA